MIHVGIAGTLSAVNRHSYALSRIGGMIITDTLSVNGLPNTQISRERCDDFIEKNDALIITDCSRFFTELAASALKKGRHVFLYPHNEIHQLIKLAREANVILKCGRIGRSGIPDLMANIPNLREVALIEFRHIVKITGDKASSSLTDIIPGDIEMISSLVKARNTSLKVKGLSFFSCNPEIISTRLEFDNGMVANYYCNIVGLQDEYRISLIMRNGLLEYDLALHTLSGWHHQHESNPNGNPIFIRNIKVEETDHFFEDLNSFVSLIHSGSAFLSIYDNGFESFILSDRILEKVSKNLVQFA